MTDPGVQPALSREDWERKYLSTPDHSVGVRDDGTLYIGTGAEEIAEDSRHALAALALYQQPFGFRQEDIALLERIAHLFENARVELQHGVDTLTPVNQERATKLHSLAARIAALLPPSDEGSEPPVEPIL